MTDDLKLKIIQMMSQGNMRVGQFIIEMNGDINATYNESKAAVEKKHDETSPVTKDAIMNYVWRLKPMVKEQYLSIYGDIWEGILGLSEVKMSIYNKGKQQDTTFNRNLVAQIIHQVNALYVPSANTVRMAEYLEPGKGVEHPVRQKLGESPDKQIKKAVEAYMKDKIQ